MNQIPLPPAHPLAPTAGEGASAASPVAQDNHFKVLRLLAANPQMSQRELSQVLGVSLGKTNYCVQALISKGLIKMESFSKSPNKLAYAYLLTPSGVAAKAGLTARFLARKLAEYENLKQEIATLQLEVGGASLAAASQPAPGASQINP